MGPELAMIPWLGNLTGEMPDLFLDPVSKLGTDDRTVILGGRLVGVGAGVGKKDISPH